MSASDEQANRSIYKVYGDTGPMELDLSAAAAAADDAMPEHNPSGREFVRSNLKRKKKDKRRLGRRKSSPRGEPNESIFKAYGDTGAMELERTYSEGQEPDAQGRDSSRVSAVGLPFSKLRPSRSKQEPQMNPAEIFLLKFSRMSTHLANERTLLAWMRTSGAFFSMGLAFAKVDDYRDDVVSISFVFVAALTFIIGCTRYYQVKQVLETKDSDFKVAQGFKRVGAAKMLFCALVAFGIASVCIVYKSVLEISTTGVHFTGLHTSVKATAPPAPPPDADAQLKALHDILDALKNTKLQGNGN